MQRGVQGLGFKVWSLGFRARTLVDFAVGAAAERGAELERAHEHGRARAQDVRQAGHVCDAVRVGRVG